MKMTDEARKAAGDRMRALNAKRRAEKEKVEVIDTSYVWLNVYFEDGRAFKIPVDCILQLTNRMAPLLLTGREIVALAETLEWAQLRGKAIPIVREQVVDETKAWRMARKELR